MSAGPHPHAVLCDRLQRNESLVDHRRHRSAAARAGSPAPSQESPPPPKRRPRRNSRPQSASAAGPPDRTGSVPRPGTDQGQDRRTLARAGFQLSKDDASGNAGNATTEQPGQRRGDERPEGPRRGRDPIRKDRSQPPSANDGLPGAAAQKKKARPRNGPGTISPIDLRPRSERRRCGDRSALIQCRDRRSPLASDRREISCQWRMSIS